MAHFFMTVDRSGVNGLFSDNNTNSLVGSATIDQRLLNNDDRLQIFADHTDCDSSSTTRGHFLVRSENQNTKPTAEAGTDQIIFDEITLDASLSNDEDGDSLTYEWKVEHITDLAIFYELTGEVVNIDSLPKGFYNVTLTVRSSDGTYATDTMFFSATGTKADYNFDGDVDGEDLALFADEFGW